jgi:hypothetical protein
MEQRAHRCRQLAFTFDERCDVLYDVAFATEGQHMLVARAKYRLALVVTVDSITVRTTDEPTAGTLGHAARDRGPGGQPTEHMKRPLRCGIVAVR